MELIETRAKFLEKIALELDAAASTTAMVDKQVVDEQAGHMQEVMAREAEGERSFETGVERAAWVGTTRTQRTPTVSCPFVRRHRRLAAVHGSHATVRTGAHGVAAAQQTEAIRSELERQLCTLIEQNSELQEVNRLCTAHIANMTHEFRISLAALDLYVELLAKGRSSRQEHYKSMAIQCIERLRQVAEDTSERSHLEYVGAPRGEMAPVDLNVLIHELVQLYSTQAETAGLTLQYETAGVLPPVMGDATLLSQLLVNLVSNAIKYTNQGWIQVKTRLLAMTNEIIIDVTDSGMGIAEGDLPYIFERFYRAHNAQLRAIPGTGLGLAIVRDIVALHRGEITVDSALGVGTRFRVRLPAV